MMFRGYTITARMLGFAVIAFAVIVAALAIPACIRKNRTEAAQARVERETGKAQVESGRDAIATVTKRGADETASEALTRENSEDIRSAPGAAVRVNSGVDVAGRRALCRRPAYVNEPKCKVFRQ